MMALSGKIKQELELRNMYKSHVKKWGINAVDSYETFKKETLKDNKRVKDNNEIIPLLQGFLTKVIEQNENLDNYFQPLQDTISKTINGENNHTKYYAVNKEEKGNNKCFEFMCKSGDALWPILTVDIEVDENSNIVSLSAKYLTTLNFEGARQHSSTELLEISDINKEEAEVTTATYPTDFFCMSFNKRESEHEWENVAVNKVNRNKEKTI